MMTLTASLVGKAFAKFSKVITKSGYKSISIMSGWTDWA